MRNISEKQKIVKDELRKKKELKAKNKNRNWMLRTKEEKIMRSEKYFIIIYINIKLNNIY